MMFNYKNTGSTANRGKPFRDVILKYVTPIWFDLLNSSIHHPKQSRGQGKISSLNYQTAVQIRGVDKLSGPKFKSKKEKCLTLDRKIKDQLQEHWTVL